MKQQVVRFSPHQNGKVMAVLMTIFSLIFIVPFVLFGALFGAGGAGASLWMIVVMPIVYLVFTYVTFAIGCAVYNALVPLIGGFEYEPAAPTE